MNAFYTVTLSVAFLTTPAVLVCLSCLTGALVFDHCSKYLLYLVFEYCLHSLIVYQTLWIYHLEQTNNQVSSGLLLQLLANLIQLGLVRPNKICILEIRICLFSLQFILFLTYLCKLKEIF